ncbi:MAG: proline dehydrogenase family protein [Actinomycetales bacterium]|nr:proline dehydrogenase family protein [Actinomycetales bacterium]
MLRKVVQSVLQNSRVQSLVAASALGEVTAQQFIAGEHVTDAVDKVLALKAKGYLASVERLLEIPADQGHSQSNTIAYLDCIRALAGAGLGKDLDLMVQLSALGLNLTDGEQVATENLTKVCQAAHEADMSVTIGLDNGIDVPATLRIAHSLIMRFENLGITLQSALIRSEQDASVFGASGARVRLSKGSAKNSNDYHSSNADIDKAFVRELRTLLRSSAYVMISTADPRILQIGQALALRSSRSKDSFEFQIYLGIAQDEQQRLLNLGHRVRIHVPFGEHWYPLVSERISRTPKSLGKAVATLWPRKS